MPKNIVDEKTIRTSPIIGIIKPININKQYKGVKNNIPKASPNRASFLLFLIVSLLPLESASIVAVAIAIGATNKPVINPLTKFVIFFSSLLLNG